MSETCPTCGQSWPQKQKRVCSQCGRAILRHDKWLFVGSRVQHRDCENPSVYPTQLLPDQPQMFQEQQ